MPEKTLNTSIRTERMSGWRMRRMLTNLGEFAYVGFLNVVADSNRLEDSVSITHRL